VIGADEKSQLRALHRRHPDQPPGPGRTRRVEFEYTRGGTLAYFAAYDVHHAHVLGQIAPRTGIGPFIQLVEQVRTTGSCASAKRVFWVVDNGSTHAGQASIERMNRALPNEELVHLNNLAERVLRFQDRYPPPQSRSTGTTPARTSPSSSPDSTSTRRPRGQHDPRRGNADDHLVRQGNKSTKR
jgi:hypothetical protein